MTAGFNIALPDQASVLFEAQPHEIAVAFRTERRAKPSAPNADGTAWGSVPVIVTLDASGRVIAETFELGDRRINSTPTGEQAP